MTTETSLKVVVHYVAAGEPFKDDADVLETIGEFKPRVLAAFGLVEGGTPDGNIVTYTLYHDGDPLEDANQTLGSLADGKKILQLKLAQQVTQG